MKNEKISANTKAGVERQKQAGYLTHRPVKFGEDYRKRAVELHEQGLGIRAIAVELGCSNGTAVWLCKCDPIVEKPLKRKTPKGKLSTIQQRSAA
jgi:DNA invertase Pin-like site-specific DNA recombinase